MSRQFCDTSSRPLLFLSGIRRIDLKNRSLINRIPSEPFPIFVHATTRCTFAARPQGRHDGRILRPRSRTSRSQVRQVAGAFRFDSTRLDGFEFSRSYIRLRQHVSAAAGARKFSPGDKIFQVVARSLSRAIVPR